MYSDVQLFIDGTWRAAAAGKTLPIVNPATGATIAPRSRMPKRPTSI